MAKVPQKKKSATSVQVMNGWNYVNGFRHQRRLKILEDYQVWIPLREHGKWLDPEIFDGEILKRTPHMNPQMVLSEFITRRVTNSALISNRGRKSAPRFQNAVPKIVRWCEIIFSPQLTSTWPLQRYLWLFTVDWTLSFVSFRCYWNW